MGSKTYPGCEKLAKHRDDIDNLMEFLVFLNKNGVQFGEFRRCVNNTPWLNPINLDREGETLAAKFFGVDMDQVTKERQEIEKSIRNM